MEWSGVERRGGVWRGGVLCGLSWCGVMWFTMGYSRVEIGWSGCGGAGRGGAGWSPRVRLFPAVPVYQQPRSMPRTPSVTALVSSSELTLMMPVATCKRIDMLAVGRSSGGATGGGADGGGSRLSQAITARMSCVVVNGATLITSIVSFLSTLRGKHTRRAYLQQYGSQMV